jgi:ubiquinone/menaquinone biosynthesis C-methylase UbiE
MRQKKGEVMKKSFFKNALALIILGIILIYSPQLPAQQKEKQPSATQQRFDDIKFWLKIFENPERDKWQKPDEVVQKLNLKPGDVIADIGAGTGYFTRRFAVAVGSEGKALGLDIEPNMVKYMQEDARKRNLKNYIARVVKPDDPGLEPQSTDVVFMCNTYHHIEQRVDYLRRLSKSLKPDGRVVIVDFYKKPYPGTPPVEHKIAAKTVIEEFWQAGYTLKRMLDFLPAQYFLEFVLE